MWRYVLFTRKKVNLSHKKTRNLFSDIKQNEARVFKSLHKRLLKREGIYISLIRLVDHQQSLQQHLIQQYLAEFVVHDQKYS